MVGWAGVNPAASRMNLGIIGVTDVAVRWPPRGVKGSALRVRVNRNTNMF